MAGAVFATPVAAREGIVQKALRKDMFMGWPQFNCSHRYPAVSYGGIDVS